MSSFTHSKFWMPQKIKIEGESCDHDYTHLRQFVMPRLISWYDLAAYTCVENLEDFSFSNFGYERRTSTWKYGWSGVIGSFKVTGNKTIRECIVSRFRDIASYSLKAVHFLLPMFFPFFQRQPLIELTSKFYRDAWRQKKLNFWGLSRDVVCVVTCLAVLIELRLVLDRWIDGQNIQR